MDSARIYCFESDSDPGTLFYKTVYTVTEASNAAGIWIPTKIVQTDETPQIWIAKRTFTATNIQLGRVTEKDVRIEFPVDSFVVDALNNTAYFIRENGKLELEPLIDPKTNTNYDPTTKTIIASNEPVSKAYNAEKLPYVVIPSTVARPAISLLQKALVGSTVMIGLAGIVFGIRKKQKKPKGG